MSNSTATGNNSTATGNNMNAGAVSVLLAFLCVCNATSPICPSLCLTPLLEFAGEGLGWMYRDGNLAFTCDARQRYSVRECVQDYTACHGRGMGIVNRTLVTVWDFVCDHEKAFIDAEECLQSTQLLPQFHECSDLAYDTQPRDFCKATECFREEIPKLDDCITDQGVLLQALGNEIMADVHGIHCPAI